VKSKADSLAIKRGGRPILIVEDDRGVSDTFALMLRMAGFDVLTAADASAGLRAMADANPSAVLVDLRMPVVDGVAFVQRIREMEPGRHTPIAVITGDYLVDEALKARLTALGAELYFKPLWLEELLRIIEKLLDKS
jgi:DNA-binding response OmpR family regulator